MKFDKPKVTIDLEEYLFLKEQTSKLETSDWYTAAKVILFAFSNHHRGVGDISKYLSENGIHFTMATSDTRYPSYEDVIVTFDPNKIHTKK